ncbi:hypothetical protein CISG_02925 [Coccidioides immitis RMSCC 3703]|uniref:Uncharacterized protein n=2 Tax=Coccidioides immitis TaxID=5501 RepID=A0A0J8QIJ5_COCIT|nr:hypothetical protein CIRG_08150 [Coccidioides immitis RMSCC 2394]KMU72276.1 hypothetical protein CISG_02925 [Coccidioides immitis RMSCC 3703]
MSDLCDYPTAKGRALGTISADGMSAMLGNDEKAQVFSDVEITSNCTALILGIAGTISSARGGILSLKIYIYSHAPGIRASRDVQTSFQPSSILRYLAYTLTASYNTAKIIPQKSTSSNSIG